MEAVVFGDSVLLFAFGDGLLRAASTSAKYFFGRNLKPLLGRNPDLLGLAVLEAAASEGFERGLLGRGEIVCVAHHGGVPIMFDRRIVARKSHFVMKKADERWSASITPATARVLRGVTAGGYDSGYENERSRSGERSVWRLLKLSGNPGQKTIPHRGGPVLGRMSGLRSRWEL